MDLPRSELSSRTVTTTAMLLVSKLCFNLRNYVYRISPGSNISARGDIEVRHMSDLAAQVISENKSTKGIFLDLGNCGLTEVPSRLLAARAQRVGRARMRKRSEPK